MVSGRGVVVTRRPGHYTLVGRGMITITGKHYILDDDDGNRYDCPLKVRGWQKSIVIGGRLVFLYGGE